MNDHLPSHRRYFSQSKPLALELGENFMSRSMVTLTKGVSITRPAALLIFNLNRVSRALSALPLAIATQDWSTELKPEFRLLLS